MRCLRSLRELIRLRKRASVPAWAVSVKCKTSQLPQRSLHYDYDNNLAGSVSNNGRVSFSEKKKKALLKHRSCVSINVIKSENRHLRPADWIFLTVYERRQGDKDGVVIHQRDCLLMVNKQINHRKGVGWRRKRSEWKGVVERVAWCGNSVRSSNFIFDSIQTCLSLLTGRFPRAFLFRATFSVHYG